ncbi:MAG: acylphosphatase [Methanothrix sp.]|nr:acylphosphatase [Methanothrix sp.]
MKLKVKITGPKVHDVGYRYFLMSMAMSNRIRMFEAHNTESNEGDEVLAFVDGDEQAVKAFRALAETKLPVRSKVSNIVFDDFDGEVMKIGEYAQFCSTVQLNKAIPLLLDMRDDLKEMKGDMKEMKGDMKEMKGDMKEMKGDMKEMKGDIKAVRTNTDAIPQIGENAKAVKININEIKEEIKGLREDIQPGYGMNFRQMQADVRAIKERLGML